MARIELCNLHKTFGAVVAVKNLSIAIEDGEFVVFVGPSGCGKTTTLRMIAGFEDPTSGEIKIDGQVVNDLEPRDRGLGMVFQSHALFPHKTVAQNIEFGLRMKRVPLAERKARVREVAEMVRIGHLLDKMPSQCSGGESQRVALARTLVTNPSTFLLDEPLSSLDAKLRRELRAECDRLHEELKRTFIFVTHDQEEAMTLADRIVVMRDGEIEQVGSPMEIYSNPVSYFVADFFGSPSMNLVAGEIGSADAGLRFRAAGFSLALPERFRSVRRGPATFGIRPEHVAVRLDGAGDLALPVRLVEPLGKDTLLYFDDGTERAFVAVSEGLAMAGLKPGARLGLSLPPDRIFLFAPDGRRMHGRRSGSSSDPTHAPPRSTRKHLTTCERARHELPRSQRDPRRHADRLGHADQDGRRHRPALRRLPADQAGQVSGDPDLRPLRQVAALRGPLHRAVAAHVREPSGRADRLDQQVPVLGGGRSGEMGAGRLCLHSRRQPRRRSLARRHRHLVAARGAGPGALRRMGGRAALVERQGRAQRHLLLRGEPVAGRGAAAQASRRHLPVGRRRRFLPRHGAPRRHFLQRLHP